MVSVILIGFVGGVITGISPCILPVLPVIFFSGASGALTAEDAGATAAGSAKPARGQALLPYRVIAGLVLSFGVFTLAGSALLTLLHLPQDAIRWAGLVALTLIGLGLIFPRVQQLLQAPFALIPQRQVGSGRSGFGLGLAAGVLYVPCAGPVLAAIVVAGATGHWGLPIIALTAAFALGAALPLLFFALAGQRVAHRVGAFGRRQRRIRVISGMVIIAFAVGLVFDLPDVMQRVIPDYTRALQDNLAQTGQIQQRINAGATAVSTGRLSDCSSGALTLADCGPAPDLSGITGWLNTPGGAPIDLKSLRGKVVLIDFWTYSCINCQRAIRHVVDWYTAYRAAGFEVIGVHTPEYAFEHVAGNVAGGAAALNISYPVVLDNNYATWNAYHNQYWPTEYLIDTDGNVRYIKAGEGDYDVTEDFIRGLLTAAHPGAAFPAAARSHDTTPSHQVAPETYLGMHKVRNYGGDTPYDSGTATFDYPAALGSDSFAYHGPWTLDPEGATSGADTSSIELDYHAHDVYLDVGGAGEVTVTRGGTSSTIAIGGPPGLHQLVADDAAGHEQLQVRLSRGLRAYSFSYG
jgi:cytochrome c biogenesis protein CcdA/thiol-disulfide isomerase/thioredoxin